MIVTPTSQPYSGWLFEAGSSQQADDDYPWLYCGILYIYDVSSVYLFAPVRSNDFNDTGKAFCIGTSIGVFGDLLHSDFTDCLSCLCYFHPSWKVQLENVFEKMLVSGRVIRLVECTHQHMFC